MPKRGPGAATYGVDMDTRTDPERNTGARLVEPGAAFAELSEPTPPRAIGSGGTDRYHVIVIGAGQAGLSIGYYLAQQDLRFVILDANPRIGDAWRKRWDSLRLFTPARYDGLDGMPFPAPPHYFPTKDEMADYLESYAEHFSLPVVTGVRVERLSRRGDRYVVDAGERRLEADQVVVATAHCQRPTIPDFAGELSDDIAQLHSADYRNPSQLQDGPVLLVGAGNSAAELARELSPHHHIWMSGPSTGKLPFRVAGLFGRLIGVPLVLKVLFMRVLSVSNPIGRKARPKLLGAGPLIRVLPKDLRRMGVERVGRTIGVTAGKPRLDDGRVLDVANVIWCSGFHSAFSWIDSADLRRPQPPASPQRDRRRGARPLLPRPALPSLDVVRHGPRRRPRRAPPQRRHRRASPRDRRRRGGQLRKERTSHDVFERTSAASDPRACRG